MRECIACSQHDTASYQTVSALYYCLYFCDCSSMASNLQTISEQSRSYGKFAYSKSAGPIIQKKIWEFSLTRALLGEIYPIVGRTKEVIAKGFIVKLGCSRPSFSAGQFRSLYSFYVLSDFAIRPDSL